MQNPGPEISTPDFSADVTGAPAVHHDAGGTFVATNAGEVFSDYDTSLVHSDFVDMLDSRASENSHGHLAFAARGVGEKMGMQVQSVDIPASSRGRGFVPLSRSFTTVTADDTQEVDEEMSGARSSFNDLFHISRRA